MKKIITTSFAVFIFSIILFAQKNVLPTNLTDGANYEVKVSLFNSPSDFLRNISATTLSPGAFTLDCFLHPEEGNGFAVFTNEENKQYLTGSNRYGSTAYGQIFTGIVNFRIESVDAYLINAYEGDVENIYAKIYSLDSNELPSNIIGTSQPVSTSDIGEAIESTRFSFSPAVEVTADFVVVIDVPEYTETSTEIVVLSSDSSCVKVGHERYVVSYMYINEALDRGWRALTDVWRTTFDLGIFVNGEGEVTSLSSLNDNYTIYPNPATDAIYIENAVDSKVRMIDAAGKIVLERIIQNSRENIEINHLQKGMYFMEITGPEGKSINKIIKK